MCVPIRCFKGVGNYLFGGAVIRVYLDSSELLNFHLFFSYTCTYTNNICDRL